MNSIIPIITNQPLDILIGALVGYFASIYKSKNNTNASLSKTYTEAVSQEIKQLRSDIDEYRNKIDSLQTINNNLAEQNSKLIKKLNDSLKEKRRKDNYDK